MKRIILVLIAFYLIFPGVGGIDSQTYYIAMENPKYPIEERQVKTKVWAVNKGNHSFNGTLNVRARQNSMFWPYSKFNVTDLEGNSSQMFIFQFFPTQGAGLYIFEAKLYDEKGRFIEDYSSAVRIRSLSETATIVAGICALLTLIIVILRR